MLIIISKVFTFLCLLRLCGNREYPGSFQNKVPSEARGKAFLKWKSIDLSSKLSLTYGGNVNYYKGVHHLIPILPVGTRTPWQFSKQISKLSFQLSFQIYSLLAQTEGERKTFFGWRVQEGGLHCEIIPESTWLS